VGKELRDSILAAKDMPEPVKVPVPEWGKDVWIKVMSGTERDALDAENFQFVDKEVKINRENGRARLLVRCLCDELGRRLFSDADAVLLGGKKHDVLDRLYDIAQKVNKLDAESIKDLSKNSEAGQSGSSISA